MGGIIFLFLGEYTGFEKNENENVSFDETVYTEELEARLSHIIEKMEGVEDVTVMITLKGGISYQYAVQTAKSLSNDSSSTQTLLEMQEDAKGQISPVLTEILLPDIKGVSVVCKGGNDGTTRGRIISLVASTLNLKENQIFVTQ